MGYQYHGIQGPWVVLPDYSKVVSTNENYHTNVTVCALSTKGKIHHRDKLTPHLIAAAPDLLSACIEALKELEFHNWANGSCGTTIKAAIHKALNIQ